MTNDYSARWFELFLAPFSPAWTAGHVAFLRRQLPLPGFSRILDVGGGTGRVAGPLAAAGHTVTVVDSHAGALAEGAARWPAVRFESGDMRELVRYAGAFDAVLCLWQSFGYFDEAANRDVLAGMARCLRPGGRLVLDLYHRDALKTETARREVNGVVVESVTRLVDRRYAVALAYSTGGADTFDWEVFTPEEIAALGTAAGVRPVLTCADFNESATATPSRQSFQVVFEKA